MTPHGLCVMKPPSSSWTHWTYSEQNLLSDWESAASLTLSCLRIRILDCWIWILDCSASSSDCGLVDHHIGLKLPVDQDLTSNTTQIRNLCLWYYYKAVLGVPLLYGENQRPLVVVATTRFQYKSTVCLINTTNQQLLDMLISVHRNIKAPVGSDVRNRKQDQRQNCKNTGGDLITHHVKMLQ